jgi:hypothetical protein
MRKLLVHSAAVAVLVAAVSFAPAQASVDAGIVPLTPHPNEHVAQPPAAIVVQVPSPAHGALDKKAIRFVIDGRDVSDAIAVSGTHVQYAPSPPLSSGEHAVEVAVTDAAGGKLSYAFTFTVDVASAQASGHAAAAATASDAATDAALPAGADQSAASTAGSAAALAAPMSGLQDDGSQSFGTFYPLAPGPYYWGQDANFYFAGVPSGWGFLTFSGVPGVFDLIPLGLGTYYATVPIPVGYVFWPPFIACHFFGPGGTPYVFPYPAPLHIVAHRAPTRDLPTVGRVTTFGATGVRQTHIHATPGQHAAPALRTSPGTHAAPAAVHTTHHAQIAAPSYRPIVVLRASQAQMHSFGVAGFRASASPALAGFSAAAAPRFVPQSFGRPHS